MFDAYPPKKYYPDLRPKCFKGSSCRKTHCDYVHPQGYRRPSSHSNDRGQYYYQSQIQRETRLKWEGTNKKIEDLMIKFPNYRQKIKGKLYLQPEEKELQYLLHRRDIHKNFTQKCSSMCGDVFVYQSQSLNKKLDFGKKHPTRTWRQVEAIDPSYIDFLCKKGNIWPKDLAIAEYICRQRKAYKEYILKHKPRMERSAEKRGEGIQERRSRSRQRQ